MSFDESKLKEIPVDRDVLRKLLGALPPHMIMVGGQALAFWVEHYGINAATSICGNMAAHISRDVDFLGRRDDVSVLASLISGVAKYPPARAMTILCGQAILIQKEAGTYMNIDVIHRIGNMDTDAVSRRAIEAELSNIKGAFLVMHPLDVLASRAENYRGIPDKQTPNGRRQVILSIDVAQSYIKSLSGDEEKRAISAIERVAEIARSPAGAIARANGVEIYDAIRPEVLREIISNENFIKHRLPRLELEISANAGVVDELPSPK
ncbi:MAG: hypothetical protein Q8O64_05765 [Sideroxyarcus sp.]|nr:hypothetical protein [Sideroxyarcus sp.]